MKDALMADRPEEPERGDRTALRGGPAQRPHPSAMGTLQPGTPGRRRPGLGSSARLQNGAWRWLIWLALLVPVALEAQTYTIDWHKIAGGAGTSTSAIFSIRGTIGQHDAAPEMSGGSYQLAGGFWTPFGTLAMTAPLLHVSLTGTNTALIWWPSPSTNWALRQNTELNSPTGWVTPGEAVNDNGTIKFIIVNPPVGKRFYRLIQP